MYKICQFSLHSGFYIYKRIIMNNHALNNFIVSQSEVAALKEMIFKRASERAQALTDEVQSSYTSSIQLDVMDLARDSFVSSKNPFSQKVEQEIKTSAVESETKTETKSETPEIGFAKRSVEEIKSQIHYRNMNVNSNIVNREVESTMDEARADFSKKSTFMGALDFLNSQASIALVQKRDSKFEALA